MTGNVPAQKPRPQLPRKPGAPLPPSNKSPTNNSGSAKPLQPARNATPGAGQSFHGADAVAALAATGLQFSRFKSRVLILLALLLCLSLAWNSVQKLTEPEPKLLGMTADGRIQQLPLLDEPVSSRSVVTDWTKRNVPELYDFNYANYRGELNKNLDIMRASTLTAFQQMLDSSGILPKVRDEFMILRASVYNEPVVLAEDVVQGIRVWVVETPLDLIYDSGELKEGRRKQIKQPIVFRAWIARASPLEYEGGLMLAKFSVQPRKD